MIQMKYILNDLVEQAYGNSLKKPYYKKFFVDMINKDLKTKHGDYNPRLHKIRIFNLYRDDASIIATTIHELAHHIDCVNRGTSAHDDSFYEVYRVLLYAALDMDLFSREEFLSAISDASDSNKVKKMISEYTITDVGYKQGKSKIVCYNAYFERDNLKSYGFTFNKINKTWEREVDDDDIETYKKALSEMSTLNYEIVSATRQSFQV